MARTAGHIAYIDFDNKLNIVPVPTGASVRRFVYGEDILALRSQQRAPIVGTVTIVGQGAAGSRGA